MEYYTSQCKSCGTDCDGDYCSWECQQDWEEGYGEYLYEIQSGKEINGGLNEENLY